VCVCARLHVIYVFIVYTYVNIHTRPDIFFIIGFVFSVENNTERQVRNYGIVLNRELQVCTEGVWVFLNCNSDIYLGLIQRSTEGS